MKKITIKDILFLQAIVVIYTFNGVLAKMSAKTEPMTFNFFAFYVAEVAVLGVYAILWQQMIKKFQLSVAYANRAMSILWSALWSIVFFHEKLTVKGMCGILLVLAGTILVNMDPESRKSDASKTEEIKESSEEGGTE